MSEKVKVKPELKENVIVFSLIDRAPMHIQKNLGGGKARCVIKKDPKSRIRNHQELVLLNFLKERVLILQRDLERSTQQLWSAEKEKDTLLIEMKRLKTENENQEERLEELLKIKITR